MDERMKIARELIDTITRMGYPEDFGIAVAQNLRTEKTMSRMIGYLRNAKPGSAEEIADEMLAIMDDRERWIQKKSAEYYNRKHNERKAAMETEYEIDVDRLRGDLEDYYGTAMTGGFPMAVMDLSNLDRASDAEVVEIARKEGVDLSKYLC